MTQEGADRFRRTLWMEAVRRNSLKPLYLVICYRECYKTLFRCGGRGSLGMPMVERFTGFLAAERNASAETVREKPVSGLVTVMSAHGRVRRTSEPSEFAAVAAVDASIDRQAPKARQSARCPNVRLLIAVFISPPGHGCRMCLRLDLDQGPTGETRQAKS